MQLIAEKKHLRRRVNALLAGLSKDQRAEESARICAALGTLPEFERPVRILAFWPMEGEPDITPAVLRLYERGIQILLPRVSSFVRKSDGGGPRLEFAALENPARLRLNRWGIREPTGRAEPIASADAAIVPCLAVDRSGRRLGHGMGYYDEVLRDLTSLPLICPIFSPQLIDAVPTETHDLSVSIIVSPGETIRTDIDA